MNRYDVIRIVISGFVGAVVVPLILQAWSKFAPAREISNSEKYSIEELIRRNDKINGVASIFSVIGILVPLIFYFVLGASKHNPWPLGLGFGLMVILPVAYISIVTFREGPQRFTEFWRYYELNYNLSIRSIFIFYILLSLLGLASAYHLIFKF